MRITQTPSWQAWQRSGIFYLMERKTHFKQAAIKNGYESSNYVVVLLIITSREATLTNTSRCRQLLTTYF